MNDKNLNLHDIFLNNCRRNGQEVRISTVDQNCVTGTIQGFDDTVVGLNESKTSIQIMYYRANIVSIESPIRILTRPDDAPKGT